MTLKDESPRSEGVQYATGEEQRATTNSFRKTEVAGSKQIQWSVVNVSGDESKIGRYSEQHCIGTWNVRSMNRGKLDMVNQEMARVNIDMLGVSELKWTWMGEFNSDDHYIYYCGQESHRRNGVALIISKRVQNVVLGMQPQKWQYDLGLFPRQMIQHHNNLSICPNHQFQRSWSWSILWRPGRSLRTNIKKKKDDSNPIHHRD